MAEHRELHLLINSKTANTTSRASNHWTSAAMRRQDATSERLRVDRQLEEAMIQGSDPLHLAEVFGLDEKTAMRYADSARALLDQAAEVGQRVDREPTGPSPKIRASHPRIRIEGLNSREPRGARKIGTGSSVSETLAWSSATAPAGQRVCRA